MRHLYILAIVSLFLSGCERNAEKHSIAQKEQQLKEWEQRLIRKEKELTERKQLPDSTAADIDSADVYNPELAGTWRVKMHCTETSCAGSAIGDTKSERWEITYDEGSIVVKAYAGKELRRVYNGSYRQAGLLLTCLPPDGQTIIHATLRFKKKNKLEGDREILKPDCETVYFVSAEKI